MSVARPHVDAEILADYWLAALSSEEESVVEEHLLSCDACGDRLRELIALADGIRGLAQDGSLRVIVSDAFVESIARAGRRVRQYAPPRGGSVQCTVTAEDDFLVARLAADLSGASRIDLALCDELGVEQIRLRDIPVDLRTGEVVYQESITFGKALPSGTLVARLFGVDEASGEQRLLGEYRFHHTRSPAES